MLGALDRSTPLKSVALLGGESLLVLSVIWAAFTWGAPVSGNPSASGAAHGADQAFKVILVAMLCQLSLYFHDLYLGSRSTPTWNSFARILQSIGVAAIIVFFVAAFAPEWQIREVILALCVLPFAVILWRTALTKWVRNSLFERKILLVGNGRLAEDVISALNVTPSFGHTIADRLQSWPLPEYSGEGDRPRSLLKLARDARIDHVVVALGDSRGRLPIDDLLQCKFSGLTVEDGLSFYERICGKVHIDALKPSWLIFSEGFKCRYGAVVVKRAFDLVGSAIGLVVLMPLGLLLAALIKLDSRGPVLYRQVRVGEHERPFVLVKFRSMRTDAEQGTGAVWAKRDDNRVTRIGKWLRLLRLDELPQLINVFRGEMSFVGPRPERPEFVEKLKADIPYYGFRHSVKPGITGWAQVRYRYGASIEDTIEKLRYDLCYIKNRTLLLDVSILIETVKIVLMREGAR